MAADWKKIVGAVAPGIATALGGPLAGVAVAALSEKLLGHGGGTEEDVATAVLTGGGEALLKVKQAEQAFQVRMRELDIDIEKVHQVDRNSAREREIKAADSWTPRLLALFVTAGFFGVLAQLLIVGKPEVGGDALLIMLGSLGGAWIQVVSYYFGSSAGSAQKTAIMGSAK